MPKYYVNFGKAYKFTVDAQTAKQAACKTLQRYLTRPDIYNEDTATVPENFRVSEKGHDVWNDGDHKEFSHGEISKLLNDGGFGGELVYV